MSAAPKQGGPELNLCLHLGLEADKFGASFSIWTGLLPVLFDFIIFSKYGQIHGWVLIYHPNRLVGKTAVADTDTDLL